jgi:predicted N-formylglutamate amidohydrolase
VLVCDHASDRVPEGLGSRGLEPDLLADRIGWDPGAADVARLLADHLDSPLVFSGYSRLVIDCNRPPGHAESIAQRSAGVSIPGNLGPSPPERSIHIDAPSRPGGRLRRDRAALLCSHCRGHLRPSLGPIERAGH